MFKLGQWFCLIVIFFIFRRLISEAKLSEEDLIGSNRDQFVGSDSTDQVIMQLKQILKLKGSTGSGNLSLLTNVLQPNLLDSRLSSKSIDRKDQVQTNLKILDRPEASEDSLLFGG